MTDDEPADAVRVRLLVGRNLARILEARGLRHVDLAERVRGAGLGRWEQSTVSRFVAGKRALTLEEAVAVCAVLGVPLVELLHGDGEATLAGATVPAAQLRDVVTIGRVSDSHRGETVLDRVTGSEADGPIAARIAADLEATPEQVEAAAYRLWSRLADDELENRLQLASTADRGIRRNRALRALFTHLITDEIRAELAPKRKRKR